MIGRTLLAGCAVAALGYAAHAGDFDQRGHNFLEGPHQRACLVTPDFKICEGNPPTIWMNPDLEPRDVANRLIGAFQGMGYVESER